MTNFSVCIRRFDVAFSIDSRKMALELIMLGFNNVCDFNQNLRIIYVC